MSRQSVRLPLHLGVAAIVKKAFCSPPDNGRQLYNLYLYI